jgi:glycosyltransferase involved in cell wall biosynthesis
MGSLSLIDTIVGDGLQRRSLPTWLDDPHLEGKVDWLGRVDWSEVRDVYQRSNVLLFSSLRDSSGAQLYEAMAFGLPVVALDHQGARDLLPEDASVKVRVGGPEDTAQGVADALESLARDPAKRARMSQAALAFAARSTWETKVRNVYSEIEAILVSRGDRRDPSARSHGDIDRQ